MIVYEMYLYIDLPEETKIVSALTRKEVLSNNRSSGNSTIPQINREEKFGNQKFNTV